MDGGVGALLLTAAVWAVGGAAARAEEPEEAASDGEEHGEPGDGEEPGVDGLADAILLDGAVQGAHDDHGRSSGAGGGHDDGQRGQGGHEVGQARGDARAEAEQTDDELEGGGDQGDDVDDLDPAGDGDVGVEGVGDGVRDGDVLADGLDGGGRDVGLEGGGVQGAGGPVEGALGAPGVVVGSGLVAVVPQVDLVAVVDAEVGSGDVGVAEGAHVEVVVVAGDALKVVERQGEALGGDRVHVDALGGHSGRHDDEDAYQRAQRQEEGDGDAEEPAGAHGGSRGDRGSGIGDVVVLLFVEVEGRWLCGGDHSGMIKSERFCAGENGKPRTREGKGRPLYVSRAYRRRPAEVEIAIHQHAMATDGAQLQPLWPGQQRGQRGGAATDRHQRSLAINNWAIDNTVCNLAMHSVRRVVVVVVLTVAVVIVAEPCIAVLIVYHLYSVNYAAAIPTLSCDSRSL